MTDVRDAPTTTSPISSRKHGDVLIVLSNNPPVNALGHAVREGLVKAIEEADADEAVKADKGRFAKPRAMGCAAAIAAVLAVVLAWALGFFAWLSG